MAGNYFYIVTSEFDIANTGGWKTLLLIQLPNASEGIRHRLLSWGLLTRGTQNNFQHVLGRLIKASNVGAGGVAISANNTRGTFEDFQATTLKEADDGDGFATEPTVSGGVVCRRFPFHPQQPQEFPIQERGQIEFGGGDIWCLQVNNDNGTGAVKCAAEITLEQ